MELKPGYKQTEVGVIPEDWSVVDYVSFGQVIDGDRGINYPAIDDLRDAGYCLFLNAGNVTKTGFRFSDCQFISIVKDKKLNKGKLERGDVVLTTRGTIGNLAYFHKEIPFDHIRINSGMVILRNMSLVADNAYQYLVLQSRIVASQLERLSFGSAQPQLTVKGISTLKIPLPPTLAEQEAIAGALSDADALIESLEQLVAKKRQIKQGAMQELLTGQRRLPGFSGEWEVKSLGEIAQQRNVRIDPRRTAPQSFCIELEHIEQGTGRLAGYTNTGEGTSLKSIFQKGDVLFGKLRAYLRKYWLADQEGVCSTEIWVLVAKHSQLISEYLFQLVMMDGFIEAASTAYGTHMPRSDWGIVKNYELQLPKLEEQTVIATVLSDMDADIAALETKLAKARQIKQGMMQELLTGRIRLVASS